MTNLVTVLALFVLLEAVLFGVTLLATALASFEVLAELVRSPPGLKALALRRRRRWTLVTFATLLLLSPSTSSFASLASVGNNSPSLVGIDDFPEAVCDQDHRGKK